jgi:ABC-type multidrug transport system fused ATPase/permease subunit
MLGGSNPQNPCEETPPPFEFNQGRRRKLKASVRFYSRALAYFKPDLLLIILLLITVGLATLLGMLSAWPMAVLVDSVLMPNHKDDLIHQTFLAVMPKGQLGRIIGLAVATLLFKFAQDVLSMIRTLFTHWINYNGLMRIRCDLYSKLQALNVAYHKSQPQGDSIYRLSTDAFGCQAILGVFIATFIALFSLFMIMWTLFSRHVQLTYLALSIVPPLIAANIWFGQQLKRRTLDAKQVDSEYLTTVQRSMASVSLIQAFCRERDEFSQFHNTVCKNIQTWWCLHWQEMFYWLIVGTTFGLGGGIVFGYGGYLVWRDQFVNAQPNGMTVGDLMIFTSYLGMLWDPLCKITGIGPNISAGAASAQRIFEVLDRDPLIHDAPDAVNLPVQPRTVELNQVFFSYGMGPKVLRDISVKIEPGQMVAFVGASGVGKSTLLHLLPRFYDPTSGSLLLDGYDMRQIRLMDLRRHIALVLQDSVLLPTTIAENITYGRPHASEAEICRAAEQAGAAHFIELLPQQYQTNIAEGSHNLSGGQRQRIAVARALLTEAPILILDEPTSALDPHHEQIITQSLRRLKGERTIILVSHRVTTVAGSDVIFVIDDGRIVEQGTHDELLARRGMYYMMSEAQNISPEEKIAISLYARLRSMNRQNLSSDSVIDALRSIPN